MLLTRGISSFGKSFELEDLTNYSTILSNLEMFFIFRALGGSGTAAAGGGLKKERQLGVVQGSTKKN